jgi:hypothetical protein
LIIDVTVFPTFRTKGGGDGVTTRATTAGVGVTVGLLVGVIDPAAGVVVGDWVMLFVGVSASSPVGVTTVVGVGEVCPLLGVGVGVVSPFPSVGRGVTVVFARGVGVITRASSASSRASWARAGILFNKKDTPKIKIMPISLIVISIIVVLDKDQ